MFKEFFFLEIRSAFRRPMIYIFFFIMALMSFGAVASDNVQIGGAIGNIYKNAPYVITQFVSLFSLIGVLFAVAFFNNAALRDHNNQFNEILFSTPLSKSSYFFGRFFGALILASLSLSGLFLGVILGTYLGPLFGWIEADRVGPLFLETFINNYLLFILPNMFFAGAIIFALAVKFKNTIISFVGAFGLIVAYMIAGTFLSDVDNETIAALSDTFGLRAWSVQSRYFTPIEKNTISPGFSGIFFQNRIIWSIVGVGILLMTYFTFSFKEKLSKVKKVKKEGNEKAPTFELPSLQPSFSNATAWSQFKSFFNISFLSITKSIVFKIIFLFALTLLIVEMVSGYEYYGLQSYPLTYIVVDMITDSTSLFLIIIMIFFSGELIWNDRSSHINEVVNATPHGSIISLLAKTTTLVGVISLLYFMFALIGIFYQLMLGFTNIELGVYFLTFIYDVLPGFLFFSVFFIVAQVLVNHKYLGYFISLLVFIAWNIILGVFEIRTNMLNLGGGPSVNYSDMNGFGPGLTGSLWFSLYWLLFAGILLAIAGLFWVRSSGGTLKSRLKIAKVNMSKSYAIKMGTICILWLATASFVYYNTQVLNTYRSTEESEQISIRYEKKYKKYQHITLPKVKEITYHIDVFPYKRDVYAKAEVLVQNESDQAIDSIHYNINNDIETRITIPKSKLVLDDDSLGYRIYELDKALQPGEKLNITIEVEQITQGFENGRGSTNIIQNGTFLNNGIIPTMGYNSNAEIGDKNDRKKFNLPPKERMADLVEHDSCTMACMNNYLSEGRSDWVKTETFISTAADQIAIAPGSLVKEWNEEGRKHYHYKVDVPSQDFCSFISAKYQVAKRDWNGISLEVYYDEKHDYNIDMMLDAIQKSLEYYTANFGPYYHKQARIIEFPNYSNFAQAFPGTMPYSESFGFIIDLEDSTKNNVIDAVVAHEMAHQWWAHQVVGASMQGGTMLSESFAEYSSLMVMKKTKSDLEMKEFIKYDFNRYLRGRGSERRKELPLYKVENQQYLHYGKGSVILYALQAYVGEDKVNNALRSFLNEFKYKAPPYPTSVDFLTHLEKEMPDSLSYLIEDWFKSITLYDLRLNEATYTQLENGKYEVTLNIKSSKIKADTIGNETKVPLKDWIDVGVFKDDDEKELLAVQRIQMDKDSMQVSMIVDDLPAKAAIDPKRLLVERVYKDNFKVVKEKE